MFKIKNKKNKNFKKIVVTLAVLLFAILLVLVLKYFIKDTSNKKSRTEYSLINSIVASTNKSIFNVRELNIKELEDRIILLNVYNIKDFSYVLSIDLANKIENIFKNKIIIIDVITDDFEFDKNTIINYIIKNNIERPIISISNFDLGNELRTDTNYFVLIDKDGIIKDTFHDDNMNETRVIEGINSLISSSSKINTEKLQNLSLEKNKNPESFIKSLNNIKYINKIKDTGEGPLFVISDPKGRMIYFLTINGNIVNQVGSGKNGKEDKNGINASFCYPSGIAIQNNEFIYVADMCNNSIRKIDLRTFDVSTLIENNQTIKKPIDLEILDDNLIISLADGNSLVKYNLKNGDISNIECQNCDKYIAKLVKYNNNVYFINSKDRSLYRINSDGKIEKTIDFNEMNENNKIKLSGNYNFNIDETGIYFVDKFNNKILKVKDNQIQDYSDNSKKKIYDLPTDIIDIRDKLYITNENDKKIIELDKNTKDINIINITFGYEYNKLKGIEENFLDINNINEVVIKAGSENKIILNLQYGYSFEKMAPQSLSIFKEDRKNNSAILIKNYSKAEILENKTLDLPKLDNDSVYYIKGNFYYCNFDKKTPCLINKYDRKILTKNSSENDDVIIDFLY